MWGEFLLVERAINDECETDLLRLNPWEESRACHNVGNVSMSGFSYRELEMGSVRNVSSLENMGRLYHVPVASDWKWCSKKAGVGSAMVQYQQPRSLTSSRFTRRHLLAIS